LITATVTSRADHTLSLDIDLLAEGVPQMRRTIAGLQPGQTQTRTFRIREGSSLLADKDVRLSAAERDGAARLNRLVHVGQTGTDRPVQAAAGGAE
jgi:hypothetical protein